MTTFQYSAKKKTAETVKGQVIADNREDAIEKITQLGLMPVAVEEKGAALRAKSLSQSGRVKLKQLYVFSRQLVSLLRAGIPILRALDVISKQIKSAYFQTVVENIRFGIQEGKSFSECLAEYPQIFSFLYVTMVKTGEESGNLKDTIADMADYLQRQEEFNSKVRNALVYPLLMALLGVGTVIFILTFVMPRIQVLFVHLGQSLPLPTMIVMAASQFLLDWWWLITVVVIMLTLAVKRWAATEAGQMQVSQNKLKMPVLGNFWLKVELIRFSRALELLLKSGISIVRAIPLSIPIVGNVFLRKQLERCHGDLLAGRTFSESLKEVDVIPEMMGYLITVGEESGSLGETLHEITQTYDQETSDVIKIVTTLLEPLMIIAVGSIIGFIVIAMLLPIFQLDVFAG